MEFPRGVDVHKRKRGLLRIKGLPRLVEHDGAVLPDGIQHHRLFALRRHLPDDVDALGFQMIQMRFLLHGRPLRSARIRISNSILIYFIAFGFSCPPAVDKFL